MLCPPLRTVLPSTPNFTGLVAAPSMHKLTSLSKFGGRWQHRQCTSSHRFQSLEEGRHQLADQPDAVHQLALDEHSQPSEKGEWVYLSRTNYIEWISFTRLTWTRSEAAETAQPHTSNSLPLDVDVLVVEFFVRYVNLCSARFVFSIMLSFSLISVSSASGLSKARHCVSIFCLFCSSYLRFQKEI